MNTPNNKRRKESQEKIERTFIQLLQIKEIQNISITDICEKCNLNRSTFYANYIDIYDLADKIKVQMINEFFSVYKDETEAKEHSYNFLKLFYHIRENQIFYKTYFKLNFDLSSSLMYELDNEAIKFLGSNKHIDYHIEFFKAGLNAILKKWLDNDCAETPEEIEEILKSEYIHKKQD